MRIGLGCELTNRLPAPTPMIVMLNVHPSRRPDLEAPDTVVTDPIVPVEEYADGFGNRCCRLLAPAGAFTLRTDGVLRDNGALDPLEPESSQRDVAELPPDSLVYLLGGRYCETDQLSDDAWRLFGGAPEGWARVQAICDFVHEHIEFGYEHSRPTRTAAEACQEARGVCRDFAHLAIAFCRCMNIPARYCTGYISDIGLGETDESVDFAAWMEVYLGGRWHVFDPRNNSRRVGRVLIAQGRDAADAPLTHTFGPNELTAFLVWIDEIAIRSAAPAATLVMAAAAR
ncbi:transglutaminase family protein [Pikeienuella piscinae]|uniref:Transglutaminase family protein n=1 Tax=Pikeienuella piscinae TaxID=2748098 RepID=A0A7L5BW94_9RHOB|nr:transglutaminase family protein [Pikeienuella piscinae]QIE55413.1 transglutaminase family protein [Pikeienuella piscinae]